MSQSISRLDTLRTLRFANIDGSLATAFGTLVGGAFLVGLIRYFHGNDWWLGLLAAIPGISGLANIVGSIWGRSFPKYLAYIRWPGVIWRLMYVPIALLPLTPLPNELKLTLLLVLILTGSFTINLVGPVYNDWISLLVPENSRGFFFSRRNAILTAVGSIVGLLGGALLDSMLRAHLDSQAYATIFGLGVVFAALSQYFFDRGRDIEREEVVKVDAKAAVAELKAPFQDRRFRGVLIFFGFFFFGQAFAGNFFSAFAIESLQLSFTQISTFALLQSLGTVVSSPLWGFLNDRYGSKPTLTLGAFGITLTPAMWLFGIPGREHMVHNVAILCVGHFLIGTIWAGVNLTQFNILIVTSPTAKRSVFLGAGGAIQSLVSGIAPLLGAALMANLRLHFAPEFAYKLLFGITMGSRLVAAGMLRLVSEDGATAVTETLRDLSTVTPRGFRAMRRLTSASNVGARSEAIRGAASAKYALASEEIARALHDPSPRVRREAAAGLAKLRDSRGAEALMHQLSDHPDLVEEETVEALGEIGTQAAVPLLSKLLQSPRGLVRRAAAKALGRLGGEEAIPALIAGASDEYDVELRRACLQALRMVHATSASRAIIAALGDSQPSIRIAAAEAVSELNLFQAAQALRQSLQAWRDEASSELAYALGVVGNEDDIPLILETAGLGESVISRRRCLLGIARLLGVESDVYRLLLLESMARDQAMLETLKGSLKKSQKVRLAVERFTQGDEKGAIEALIRGCRQPQLQPLADHPVPEAFLVAACFVMRHGGEFA